jgi:hypothetical protein
LISKKNRQNRTLSARFCCRGCQPCSFEAPLYLDVLTVIKVTFLLLHHVIDAIQWCEQERAEEAVQVVTDPLMGDGSIGLGFFLSFVFFLCGRSEIFEATAPPRSTVLYSTVLYCTVYLPVLVRTVDLPVNGRLPPPVERPPFHCQTGVKDTNVRCRRH